MGRRLLVAGTILAVMLVGLMPSAALAGKPVPFAASGTISSISPGDVFPAGGSGRYVVVTRDLKGNLSGDVSGDFVLNFQANVALATQAGNLHGVLTVGDNVLEVNGKSEPLVWEGTPFASPAMLEINGRWTFADGAEGQGTFGAWAEVVLTPLGHVDFILDSQVTMTGQWSGA